MHSQIQKLLHYNLQAPRRVLRVFKGIKKWCGFPYKKKMILLGVNDIPLNEGPLIPLIHTHKITFENKQLKNVSFWDRKNIIKQAILSRAQPGEWAGFTAYSNKTFSIFNWEPTEKVAHLVSELSSLPPVIYGVRFFCNQLINYTLTQHNCLKEWLIIFYPDPIEAMKEQAESYTESNNWFMVVAQNGISLFQRTSLNPDDYELWNKDLDDTLSFLKRYGFKDPNELSLIVYRKNVLGGLSGNFNIVREPFKIREIMEDENAFETTEADIHLSYGAQIIQKHIQFFKRFRYLYSTLMTGAIFGLLFNGLSYIKINAFDVSNKSLDASKIQKWPDIIDSAKLLHQVSKAIEKTISKERFSIERLNWSYPDNFMEQKKYKLSLRLPLLAPDRMASFIDNLEGNLPKDFYQVSYKKNIVTIRPLSLSKEGLGKGVKSDE